MQNVMLYKIDDKVYNFILYQRKQVKDMFLEILDQIPILLEKIDNNLQINAFESAMDAKDTVANRVLALSTHAMQYHKEFGITDKIWTDGEVKMVMDEGQRLYGIATDLVVSKLRKLSKNKTHVHI